MSALLLALAVSSASAQEVEVRNDTAGDTFGTTDIVAWLEHPECAISVLTADPAELPLSIDVIRFYFGSSQGNQDGAETLVQVGIQQLAEGAEPTGLGDWVWGEEAFYATVSSTSFTDLSLDLPEEGLFPVEWTEGSLAVFLCPPDPSTGESWPFVNALDTSGIVIHTSSPSAGNYVLYEGSVRALSSLGASGSWIIRAVQTAPGGGSGGGSGGSGGSGGDGGADGTDGGSGDGGSGGLDSGLVLDIASITPASGELGAATEIAIVGEGFAPGAEASIGGLTVSSADVPGHTALTGRSPSALPAGVHDVTVTNPSGESVTLVEGFTVVDPAEGEPVEEEGGCACSAGGSAAGLLWLAGPLALWHRRRRD